MKLPKRKDRVDLINWKRLDTVATINSEHPHSVKMRVLLHDFSIEGIGVFVSEPILLDTQITLEIPAPYTMILQGRCVWCTKLDVRPTVIKAEPFTYRAGILLTYTNPAERKRAEEFYHAVKARD